MSANSRRTPHEPHVIEYMICIPILFKRLGRPMATADSKLQKTFTWFAIEKNDNMDSNSGKKGTHAVSLAILADSEVRGCGCFIVMGFRGESGSVTVLS